MLLLWHPNHIHSGQGSPHLSAIFYLIQEAVCEKYRTKIGWLLFDQWNFSSAALTVLPVDMSGPDPLIHDVQQTAEYRELNRQTQKDMKNLGKKLEPLAVNLINTELSFDTRIQIFGETISSTLMARNHRGGYTTNSSGLYSLKVDFM